MVSPRPPLEAGGVDGRRGQVQVRVLAGRRRVVEPRKPEEFANYTRKPSYVPEYTWHERMSLSPFTLSEVNKGYLVQNPGY